MAAVWLVSASTAFAQPASAPSAASLEQRQWEQLRSLQRQMATLPDSPDKQRLQGKLDEIERRLRQEDLYVAPTSKLSPAMAAWVERLTRRIEDCGTRHWPEQGGRRIYGGGIASLSIGKDGRLRSVEIVEASGQKALDDHFQKVARASSPFGALPAQPLLETGREWRHVVYLTRFHFTKDSQPAPDLPDNERCAWK